LGASRLLVPAPVGAALRRLPEEPEAVPVELVPEEELEAVLVALVPEEPEEAPAEVSVARAGSACSPEPAWGQHQ
jgi:hypothetical protein